MYCLCLVVYWYKNSYKFKQNFEFVNVPENRRPYGVLLHVGSKMYKSIVKERRKLIFSENIVSEKSYPMELLSE